MKKKNLRKMFPDWASPEAIIERIRKEYKETVSDSDMYFNINGDVVITMDLEHIIIFRDEERHGLYTVARMRISDGWITYSDANTGLKEFQS